METDGTELYNQLASQYADQEGWPLVLLFIAIDDDNEYNKSDLADNITMALSDDGKTTQLKIHNSENALKNFDELVNDEKEITERFEDVYKKYMDDNAIIRLTFGAMYDFF